MTAKTTITITGLQLATGEVAARTYLTVKLNAGPNGGSVDGSVVGQPGKIRTDADGDASIALFPSAAYAEGTLSYTISVDGSSELIYRTILVPASGGPYDWADEDIQTARILPGGLVPPLSTGDPLDVLRQNDDGSEAEWAAPLSITEVPGAVAALTNVYLAIGAEESARVAADFDIQFDLGAEVAARGAADVVLTAEAERLAVSVTGNASAEGAPIPTATPYLLVGSTNPADGSESAFTTPHPAGVTFDDGIDVVITAAMISGANGVYGEALSHLLEGNPINFDMNEDAFYVRDGRLELFQEHVRVGDPITPSGEYAAGRIFTSTVPFYVDWSRLVTWRKTIRNNNGSGAGVVTIWHPAIAGETVVETAHGIDWAITKRITLGTTTSVMTDPDGFWSTGFGECQMAVVSAEAYEYGGDLVLAARAADVQLDGTLQPADLPGQTWTPTGDATVVDPSASGSATTDASLLDTGILPPARIGDASITVAKLAAALTERLPTEVLLGSNVASTTGVAPVLADATGMSFPVTAGKSYLFEMQLRVTGSSTGDMQIALTFPTGTMIANVRGITNSASAFPANVTDLGEITVSGTAMNTLGTFTGATVRHIILGRYVCTSSGTVQLQFAQRSNDATATTILAGSNILYRVV